METNEFQRYFIRCACDLNNHILDFDLSDEEFEETTGVTKEYAKDQIENLREAN